VLSVIQSNTVYTVTMGTLECCLNYVGSVHFPRLVGEIHKIVFLGRQRIPGTILVKNYLMFINWQAGRLHQIKKESIYQKIFHQCWLVAYWTDPLGLLLIHHKVQLSIKTLEMITSGGSARSIHPHLAKRTGQSHLAGGGGNLLVLIGQLLLDKSFGVVWLSLALPLQLVQQVLVSEVLHLVDRYSVGLPHLHCPGHSDSVGGSGAQLTEGCNIHWERWSFGFSERFGEDDVGKRAELSIDLDTGRPGEVVHLVAGGLQQGEPHLYLLVVFKTALLILVPGVGDFLYLPWSQAECEVLLLDFSSSRRLQAAWLEQSFLYFKERKLLKRNIREGWIYWLAV